MYVYPSARLLVRSTSLVFVRSSLVRPRSLALGLGVGHGSAVRTATNVALQTGPPWLQLVSRNGVPCPATARLCRYTYMSVVVRGVFFSGALSLLLKATDATLWWCG